MPAIHGPDRKDKRAIVLRRIIYLKRRCNRCYLVNVMASLFNVILHGSIWSKHSKLIAGQSDFFYQTLSFVAAAALMLIGSIAALYAMTKKLKKLIFLFGNILMTAGLVLTVVAVFESYIFPSKSSPKNYGYPQIYIEDCQAYPDHTFSFILMPESRRGRPIGNSDETKKTKINQFEDMDMDFTTTETVVAETYNCPELLANIQLFKFLYYLMWSFLIVTSVTVTLSYVGIIHLSCLSRSSNLIMPVSIVEPYEDYDEVLVMAQKKLGNRPEHDRDEMELRGQEFENLNMDLI